MSQMFTTPLELANTPIPGIGTIEMPSNGVSDNTVNGNGNIDGNGNGIGGIVGQWEEVKEEDRFENVNRLR